jgi:hypothetical protein
VFGINGKVGQGLDEGIYEPPSLEPPLSPLSFWHAAVAQSPDVAQVPALSRLAAKFAGVTGFVFGIGDSVPDWIGKVIRMEP